MEKLDLSKKRPFNSITEVPILATSEEKIKEAMMQYHQDTFLPNLNALIDNCRKFYHNTIHELYYNQLKVDMMDSRLKTLEARFGNKSLLIKGLPAHGHNRTELERNVWHYFQKSGVSWECLAAMSTHTLKTDGSVMRLEFTTEIVSNEFFQHMRNTKNAWLIHGKEYGKAKVKNDIRTSDRLSLQPYYALLDLSQGILPADMKGSNGELQSDRATLQIRLDKNASTPQLLAQVTYLLDNRFPRRYLCVLFIVENYLEEIQQKLFDAFTTKYKLWSLFKHSQDLLLPRLRQQGTILTRPLTPPTFDFRISSFHFRWFSSAWLHHWQSSWVIIHHYQLQGATGPQRLWQGRQVQRETQQ